MSYAPLSSDDQPPAYEYAVAPQQQSQYSAPPQMVRVHHHSAVGDEGPPSHVAGGSVLAVFLLVKSVLWFSLAVYVFVDGTRLLHQLVGANSNFDWNTWYKAFAGLLVVSIIEILSALCSLLHGCALGCCTRLPMGMHKIALLCWVMNLVLEIPLLLVTGILALIFKLLLASNVPALVYVLCYAPFGVSLVAFIWTCVVVHKARTNLRLARMYQQGGNAMRSMV